jgi:hypothetical protein
LLGLRSSSTLRIVASAAALGISLLVVAGLTRASDAVIEDATTTYERSTSQEAHEAIAQGGSAVELEGSGGSAYALALLYTLFAPFPWQGGSVGLQVAKFDSFIWYCVMYLALKGTLRLWRTRRTEMVILVSFIVPTTFAYAAAFANVGLTVRERLGVVMLTALLAAMGAASAESKTSVAEDPSHRIPRTRGQSIAPASL